MREEGLLLDNGTCALCSRRVGSLGHKCGSPLVTRVIMDLSGALPVCAPWGGLNQEQYTQLPRQQGQLVFVLPAAKFLGRPETAVERDAFMVFQAVIARSRVAAPGGALGVFSLLPLVPEGTGTSSWEPAHPGHPTLQQTHVCVYTGRLLTRTELNTQGAHHTRAPHAPPPNIPTLC